MTGTFILSTAFWLACLTISAQTFDKNSPNIILILADDLGYGDLSSYGADSIATPNLDRLASEGVRFTSFYANGAECTPTRAALLTGRYQQRVGGLETAIGIAGEGRYADAIRLAKTHDLGLPTNYNALPSILKKVGYATAIIGKWHLGYEAKFSPAAHGFDYSIGPLGAAVDYFHHSEPVGEFLGHKLEGSHDFYRNGVEQHRQGYYLTHLITDESVNWINQQKKDNPFFLYIPFTAPHSPYQGADDFKPEKLTAEEDVPSRETYIKMVESLDKGIGKILEKLQEKGLDRNTIVIFFSDNGPTLSGRAKPFSGNKASVFEGGIRVPCIMRWPGHIKPHTVSNQMAIGMDITASITRLAKTSAPDRRPFDGVDIVKDIEQNRPPYPRTLFWRRLRGENEAKAVRQGDLKYIHINRGTSVSEHLFNIREDPREKNDLLAKRPEDVKQLKKFLKEWEAEVKPER